MKLKVKIKLYRQFEHWYHGGTIWIYSDPHFGDEDNELRGWPSDNEQVESINKCVNKNDAIIFLGDIGDIEPIKKIKGYKVLLMGNHDKGWSNYIKKYQSFLEDKILFESSDLNEVESFNLEYLYDRDKNLKIKDNRLFDEVFEGPLFINNKILLSHEPINLSFGYNIHGHSHGGIHKISTLDNRDKYKRLQINMAADVINFKPIRLDTLVSYGKVEDIHRQAIDKQRSKKECQQS